MVEDFETREAREALQERIEKLSRCSDAQYLAQELHSIKGVAAAYGFQQAARYAHALEDVLHQPILNRDLQRALDQLAAILEHEQALPLYALNNTGSASSDTAR
jgi:HPt (histidine-containing phosphotransfer) domain-containing protein